MTSAGGISTHTAVLKTHKWSSYSKLLMGNAGNVSPQQCRSLQIRYRNCRDTQFTKEKPKIFK